MALRFIAIILTRSSRESSRLFRQEVKQNQEKNLRGPLVELRLFGKWLTTGHVKKWKRLCRITSTCLLLNFVGRRSTRLSITEISEIFFSGGPGELWRGSIKT